MTATERLKRHVRHNQDLGFAIGVLGWMEGIAKPDRREDVRKATEEAIAGLERVLSALKEEVADGKFQK